MVEVEDIGEKTSHDIVEFFKDNNIKESIDKLLDKGIKINEINENEVSDSLDGMKIVITGSIENYKRNDIKKLIIDHKGDVTSSVSKNTDLVLCGEKPGSKKEKADQLGIKILEDEELFKFIRKLEED